MPATALTAASPCVGTRTRAARSGTCLHRVRGGPGGEGQAGNRLTLMLVAELLCVAAQGLGQILTAPKATSTPGRGGPS